ncbi:hypothetical protein [Halobellus ruber]|uniref:Uncharacterized protein n=1 Tax=Halobellus ruber TaxID=2761102 RepID=A0A7J9SHY8_9EURY|nr:hypothetical protein [Halobellus ruber]MBB6645587.1 hypothetical protein [Halobellus ruber]
MNLKLILAAIVVLGAGAGVVVAGDMLPGGNGAADAESFPTATPGGEGTATVGSDGPATTTADGASTATPPFGFTIDKIEKCGQTCRDVTSTLTNQQDATAENGTVHTRIFAGRGTDGDEIWRGNEDVGTLPAGDSYTTTRQVELSYAEALKISNNDGWITVQTTVETENRTVTFTDERKVA